MTRQFNFRLCVLASLQLPQILPFQFLDSFQTDISEGSSPFAGNLFLRIAGFTLLRKRSAADIGQTGISTLISTFLGNLPLPTSLLPYEPLQTLDFDYQLFSPLLLLPAALLIHSQPLLQLFHLYLRAICLIAYFEILVVMLLEFGVFSLYFGVLAEVSFGQLANLHVFRGELFHETFDLLPKGGLPILRLFEV